MTDALLMPLLALLDTVVGWLPVGTVPNLPSLDPLWDLLGGLDRMVPVLEPLAFMLGLLAVGVVFVTVRLVLTVWNLIYP